MSIPVVCMWIFYTVYNKLEKTTLRSTNGDQQTGKYSIS